MIAIFSTPIVLVVLFGTVTGSGTSCKDSIEPKDLQKGCSVLKGATIVSLGGTIVNETKCDVLLPHLIFNKEPKVFYNKANPEKNYTIVAVNRDMPQNGEGEYYSIVIKSNIAGDKIASGNTHKQGSFVLDYLVPTLKGDTGFHRFMFLIYEQEDYLIDTKSSAPKQRNSFDLNKWTQGKHLCGPVAGVQFRAVYDV